MPLTAKQLEKILLKNGWHRYSSKGSHVHYKHKTLNQKITIPFHGNDLKLKTTKNILNSANLDWRKYL